MKKVIEIILLGGTIASTINNEGNEKVIDLSDSLKEISELDNYDVEFKITPFKQLSGYDTKIIDMIDTANKIKSSINKDKVDGIVVVMGTNILEEFSFGIQLLINTSIPIIFTGAMRTPTSKGADGPANLLSSINVAMSDKVKNLGVLIVMDETIHSANFIRKGHPQNPSAFSSEFPLGYVAEGLPSIRVKPIIHHLPWLDIKTDVLDVLIYTSYMGDSGKILSKVNELGYSGLVVEGTGYGVVAEWVFDYLELVHKKIPIVMSTRIGNGDTMTQSYGQGYGLPLYMKKNNYIFSHQLDSRKSRILLTLLLMSKCSNDEIHKSFEMFSKYY